MELPKFHETFQPILEVLKDGKTFTTRELISTVARKYYSHLDPQLLEQKTKSGENLLFNRIAWGKSYLKKGGFLSFPERGHVKITPKGISNISNVSLDEVIEKSSFLTFYNSEDQKVKANDAIANLQTDSPQDLIDKGFLQVESATKSELLERLKNIDPYYFEKVVLILLQKMGYGDFVETSKSSDGGIDGIINEDKLGLDRIYIQAKRFTENKVREKDIRNFIGAMSGDTNKGVFVTTSEFDSGAINKAKQAHHKIILIDGVKLVDLMHQYNVGVQIKSTYEIKQIDEDFFQEQ
ncbi:MAG: restriction endonuclease [Ilyomonas sp.]